jgi:signal transduction histidine kinase
VSARRVAEDPGLLVGEGLDPDLQAGGPGRPRDEQDGKPTAAARSLLQRLWSVSPLAVWVASVVLTALGLVLYNQNRVVPAAQPFFNPVMPAVALIFPGVGSFIVSTRRCNVIGWLFCLSGLLGLAFFADQYAAYTLATDRGAFPGGVWMAWLAAWVWVPGLLAPRILLLLLFPEGQPLSTAWRRVVWTVGALLGVATALAAVGNLPTIDAPAVLRRLPHLLGLALGPVALAGLVVRYRQSEGTERSQLRLFTWGAWVSVVTPLLAVLLAVVSPELFSSSVARAVYQGLGLAGVVGLAAGTVVAIVRHGLYSLDTFEIESLVRRGIMVLSLAVAVTAVYGAMLALLDAEALVDIFSVKPGLARSLVALAVVVAALQPLRKLLQLAVNRLRHERLAAETLADLGHRLEGTLTPEEVLPAIVDTIASTLKVPYVAVEVWQENEGIAESSRGVPQPGPVVLELRHQNDTVGRLMVAQRAPNTPLHPAQRRLLDDLANQAGVAAHVVRLTAELQRSRARVVAAADAERRRIERDLHDGAQQSLVALSVNLGLARKLMTQRPEDAGAMLDQLAAGVGETLQELRDLAHGIYPPLLAERGLVDALRGAANRSLVDALVEGAVGRYRPEVEATVYFCCLEAIQNAAKHGGPGTSVTIRLSEENGSLSFVVTDDGPGFDPARRPRGHGLTNMSDRLAALGGTLRVQSRPGSGTTVSGSIPLARDEPGPATPASTSGSTPT